MPSDRYDAQQDARSELAPRAYVSPRDAILAAYIAPHGNGDLYPTLRDRHPYGWSPFPVPTDGHPARGHTSPPARPMTPDGPRTLPSPGARADGSTDTPDLAA